MGRPRPHAWQRETSLFGVRLWRAHETKKARPSLLQATSPVECGVRRFNPPAAGCCRGPADPLLDLPEVPAGGFHPCRPSPLRLLAAVRPLVRMPTNRHAATGTCEIGHGAYRSDADSAQEKTGARRSFLAPCHTRSFLSCRSHAEERPEAASLQHEAVRVSRCRRNL
jgi:hypothetical protein